MVWVRNTLLALPKPLPCSAAPWSACAPAAWGRSTAQKRPATPGPRPHRARVRGVVVCRLVLHLAEQALHAAALNTIGNAWMQKAVHTGGRRHGARASCARSGAPFAPTPPPRAPHAHHRVRVVDVDVVVLAADGLLHERLLDAHAVQLDEVLALDKAGGVGAGGQLVARHGDVVRHGDGRVLGGWGGVRRCLRVLVGVREGLGEARSRA